MCLLSTKYGVFCGENVLSDREVHRGETRIPGNATSLNMNKRANQGDVLCVAKKTLIFFRKPRKIIQGDYFLS